MRLTLMFASTALAGSVLVAGCSDGMFGRSSTATPSTAAQQAAAQPVPSADMRDTQQQLRSLGLYDGPVDGLWGPETQAAVERYQRQRGLAATGRVDEPTRASLQQVSAGRAGTATNQDRMAATTPGMASPGTSGTGTTGTGAATTGQTTTGQTAPRAADIAPAAGLGAAATIAPRNLSAANVRAIQGRLADQGIYRARVDGVWGPQSDRALVTFQTQKGLRADGRLDPRTANALNLDYQLLGDAGWGTQPGRDMQRRSRDTTGERVRSERPGPDPSAPRQ